MSSNRPNPKCTHCGHIDHDWKDGSAWSFDRPEGEYPCRSCGKWCILRLEDDLWVSYESWGALSKSKAGRAKKGTQ